MDMRSFALNYEVSLMLLGDDVVHRLQAVEDHYRSVSRELTLEEWSAPAPRTALGRQRHAPDRRAAVTVPEARPRRVGPDCPRPRVGMTGG